MSKNTQSTSTPSEKLGKLRQLVETQLSGAVAAEMKSLEAAEDFLRTGDVIRAREMHSRVCRNAGKREVLTWIIRELREVDIDRT